MEKTHVEHISPAGLATIDTTTTSFAMTLTHAGNIYALTLPSLDAIAESSPFLRSKPADIMLYLHRTPTIWSIDDTAAAIALVRETTYSTSYVHLTLTKGAPAKKQ